MLMKVMYRVLWSVFLRYLGWISHSRLISGYLSWSLLRWKEHLVDLIGYWNCSSVFFCSEFSQFIRVISLLTLNKISLLFCKKSEFLHSQNWFYVPNKPCLVCVIYRTRVYLRFRIIQNNYTFYLCFVFTPCFFEWPTELIFGLFVK